MFLDCQINSTTKQIVTIKSCEKILKKIRICYIGTIVVISLYILYIYNLFIIIGYFIVHAHLSCFYIWIPLLSSNALLNFKNTYNLMTLLNVIYCKSQISIFHSVVMHNSDFDSHAPLKTDPCGMD